MNNQNKNQQNIQENIQNPQNNNNMTWFVIYIYKILFSYLNITREIGSFWTLIADSLYDMRHIEDWTKLLKKNFKFVGIEIAAEFLKGSGLLPGAHDQNCYLKHTEWDSIYYFI